MELGDIVLYQGRRWWVHRRDKMTRTVFLYDQKEERTELADQLDLTDPDTVKVLASPSKNWRVLTAPFKANAGPFVRFVVPGTRQTIELVPWKDWISSDPFREGGSLFVRKSVPLPPYTVVLLTHKNGDTVRVTIPAKFTTVARKKAPPPKAPEKLNRFNLIDDDD